MQRTSRAKLTGWGLSLIGGVALSVLCTGAWATCAVAQPEPPASQPEAKPTDQQDTESQDRPAAAPPAEPAPEVKPEGKEEPKDKAKPKDKPRTPRRAGGKGKRGATFKMNPDAKWACDNATATLEPVWRGKDKLTFTFKIRNQGTADLLIKARGG